MTAKRTLLLFLLSFVYLVPAFAAPPIEQLELIKAVPIDGKHTEPSGLAYCRGHLLMVSDNDQEMIFRLEPESVAMTPIEYLHLENIPSQPIELNDKWGYDWEAIDCDEQENLYLMSEELGNVLVVKNHGVSHWLNIPIYSLGSPFGFFTASNAGAEGIVIHEPNAVVVAAERSEPGILSIDMNSNKVIQHHVIHQQTVGAFAEDVSDLHREGSALYSLQRFHGKICRRNLQAATLEAEHCWSFKHIEKAEENLYKDSFYGKAEGLARIEDKIFVVLDNNGEHRKNDSQDNRPLMFIFKKPTNW